MHLLVAGASGYIGQRLLPTLLAEGHRVTCLVRDPARFAAPAGAGPNLEILRGDLLDPYNLPILPGTIEGAYYLVHSMTAGEGDFREKEAACARNFTAALKPTACRHIVYLSGIANDPRLSHHLSSRVGVESVLQESGIPVTVLRAAIIIGSGSASFEIIRDLVEKLPIMIAPRWLNTRCQPIGVRDVVVYLTRVLDQPAAFGKIWDIGGPDVLSYREMLLGFAQQRRLRRWIHTVPVLTPRLSSYWLYFITSTSYHLACSLVDSMKNEVVVERTGIETVVPHTPADYATALARAFEKIDNNQVLSSWKDSIVSGTISDADINHLQVPRNGVYRDEHILPITRPVAETRALVYGIGGDRGWYVMNWAWSLRGLLDRFVGGIGLRRGRRNKDSLRIGDPLDFWRVLVTDTAQNRLTLYAEMKLPGEAWLEFEIQGETNPNLRVTTIFRPRGVLGRLYWYGILPMHRHVFRAINRFLAQPPKNRPLDGQPRVREAK
ncbi:SDR family oxidoreductase [Acanthopleuribacter pedis]|uniref:SDR family oxidoreductase n=1 Tax=Acanthopleuribacter pedis TaxID=442870 RepID=A0A8J7QP26_9BACT|nr:SDR family oxidoreductase [Acanthopleuribacter pedis]MBO1322655.1 SDR family oxidoreductase [Acanthopleuribacter pedis]